MMRASRVQIVPHIMTIVSVTCRYDFTKTIPERRIQYCNSFDAFVKAPGSDNQDCARARKETYRNLDMEKEPIGYHFQVPSQRKVLHSIMSCTYG